MDLRSTRRDANTNDVAAEQHEHELNDADLRSARLQRDTDSDQSEQIPEQPAEKSADTDLTSTRPPLSTDFENDEMTPQNPPENLNSNFPNYGGMTQLCPETMKLMTRL